MTTIVRPTKAQLVRIKRRVDVAMDEIEKASNSLLDALRVFDGEKLPMKEPYSVGHSYIERAEAVLDAATALLATALGDVVKQTPGDA